MWAEGLDGFGVRISPTGTKSFIYKYDIEGRDRFLTFGQYPKIKLAEALEKYGKARVKVERGEDPADEHVEANQTKVKSPTVSELIKLYVDRYAKPNKRTWKEDERILNREFKPKWGASKAATRTPAMAARLINEIVERGAPVMANRTLAVGRKMYRWAIDQPDINTASSPFADLKPPGAENSGERFLTLEEILIFWSKVESAPLSRLTKAALKLLLVTMQRSSEVIGLHTSEINREAQAWIIPGRRTKNKRPHLVPLSPLALEIVDELTRDFEEGEEGYLFPGKWDNDVMSKSSLSHAIRENFDHFGISKFTPHDLRRTGSTQLGAFKVPRFDRERILNHTDQTVGAVYDLYEYEDEKRAALNLWADIICHCASSTDTVNEKKLKTKLKYRDYFED